MNSNYKELSKCFSIWAWGKIMPNEVTEVEKFMNRFFEEVGNKKFVVSDVPILNCNGIDNLIIPKSQHRIMDKMNKELTRKQGDVFIQMLKDTQQ
jgi:hypothetical protein